MKTKKCPYCGKELSAEAVLCKYCHNLLIDDNGNMAGGDVEDKTRVFTKQELEEAEDKTRTFKAVQPQSVIEDDSGDDNDNAAFTGNAKTADEVFDNDDFEYDDDFADYSGDDEAERKRMFIIIACITVCIIIIVIAAIIVAMKLFGSDGDGGNTASSLNSDAAVVSIAETAESEAEESKPDDTATDAETIQTESSAAASENSDAEDSETSAESSEEDSSSEDDNNTEESSSETDDASSETESDSSQDDTNYVIGQNSSSSAADSSASDSSSADAPAEPENGDYESIILEAVAGEIEGEVTDSQFREDNGETVYYYFFTEGGLHGYSVAYNKKDGTYVVDHNY